MAAEIPQDWLDEANADDSDGHSADQEASAGPEVEHQEQHDKEEIMMMIIFITCRLNGGTT